MQENPKISEEIKKIEYEPLLPIEKKLITWSIITGLGLIIILYIINRLIIK
ncbi:MAG: hypothetical protein CH6_0347 [Candidatus Kapaibacterium sp.]|nr:MAG: hypothetical protein CH6_0347 [Candidatus Kapabacteria bacterium]